MTDEVTVRWLLDRGADPNVGAMYEPPYARGADPPPSNTGVSLNAAACYGTTAVFDLLIERGAKLEDSAALHCAADSPNEDAERIPMIQHLLEIGLDINGTDDVLSFHAQGTPLHWAVDACKIERAKFLLEKGADPHKVNRDGVLPVQMIARSGVAKETRKEFVELFQRWS